MEIHLPRGRRCSTGAPGEGGAVAWRGRGRSYESRAPGAAAAVVAVGVAAGQVGRGHEWVSLVGATVLRQRVHALLTVGLPGVRHGAVAVGVPRHQVHTVLRNGRENSWVRAGSYLYLT